MNDILKITVLAVAFAAFMYSGFVAHSRDSECPTMQPEKKVSEYEFLKAHGLTQETFSIWLKEHSEWRRKFDKDLEEFSYIHDKDFETKRQGD